MKSLKFGCVLLAGFVLTAGAQAQVAPAAAVQPTAADVKLRALYNGYALWDAKESEQFEDARGESKHDRHLQFRAPKRNHRLPKCID